MIADNKPLSVTCKILALSAMELHDQLALAAAVTEHVGLEDQDVGAVGGDDCVGHEEVLDCHASLAMRKQPSGVEFVDLGGQAFGGVNQHRHSLCVTRAKNCSRANWLSSTLTGSLLVERRSGE